MNNKSICKKVSEMIMDILEKKNDKEIELYDVEFVKEGPNHYLRVYIDKKDGVLIKDCISISKKLNEILDNDDFIEKAYILEVSSPGVDRLLKKDKDFLKYIGFMVDLKLYSSLDGCKRLNCKLVGLEGSELIISINDLEKKINRDKIATCRLAINI